MFTSQTVTLLARRRDRFTESLDLLGEAPGNESAEHLLIDLRKLLHVIEIVSRFPVNCFDTLSALEVAGSGFEHWRDLGQFETFLATKLDDPTFLKGKRKAPAQLPGTARGNAHRTRRGPRGSDVDGRFPGSSELFAPDDARRHGRATKRSPSVEFLIVAAPLRGPDSTEAQLGGVLPERDRLGARHREIAIGTG